MTLVQELLARMTPEQAKAVRGVLKSARQHKTDKHDPFKQQERRLERQSRWRKARGSNESV